MTPTDQRLKGARKDCSPEFAPIWDRLESSPTYWLELALLEIDEERFRRRREIKSKGDGLNLPDAFWQWCQGNADGLGIARKIIKRLIRKQTKT